jgi:putative radical SAM enzyme (TIGR03279 family)
VAAPTGGVIAAIRPGSPAARAGLRPGDRLLAINGHPLRDLIDFRYYGAEERLALEYQRGERRTAIRLRRDYDSDLGIEFTDLTFDGLRQCDNRCPFCFVRQMPKGMRPSLYIRDDDYRYSFLLGNFVTLTNLTEADWARIAEQRLSPLYVSVHATDPAVRRAVLGNPEAPEIVPQLRHLGEMGIRVHGQIVISPGVNDGDALARSISESAGLWPTVQTLAVVPVGLTRFHRDGVRLMRPDEAAAVLDLAADLAPELRRRTGRTWLYPSDEMYLLAGRPVPERDFYDDDEAQLENGVGLVRQLLDDWDEAREYAAPPEMPATRVTWVCGTSIAPTLARLGQELAAATGVAVQVQPVANSLLGDTVTVSGLLGGEDVLVALQGAELGERVFLPRAMFDAEGAYTLDNLTPTEMAARLGRPVSLVATLSEVLDVLDGIA